MTAHQHCWRLSSHAFDGVTFSAPALVSGLNTAANDARPNLRRDGLEVFFDSNRSGGSGGLDLWTSSRASTADSWTTPRRGLSTPARNTPMKRIRQA